MNGEKSTCVQTVILTFNLYPKTGKYKRGLQLPGVNEGSSLVEDIDGLKDYLSKRLARISQMVDLLVKLNSGWKVVNKRDKVILETTLLEFNGIQKILSENGFAPEEFELIVDYSRKWGVL